MKTWTRRYRTRARGIAPPDVEETRRQEIKRLRRRYVRINPTDQSDLEENGHRNPDGPRDDAE